MANQSWVQLLNANQYSQTQLGTALANSTTLTDISPGANTAGQAFNLPANYLQLGQQWRVSAVGIISNTGTPNLTLGLYYGGTAGTAITSTGVVATVTGLSNSIWRLAVDLRVDAVGASGAVRSSGSVYGVYSGVAMMPATSSSGNSVTINTSTSNNLTLGATWGTASASNSIQVIQFVVEYLYQGIS